MIRFRPIGAKILVKVVEEKYRGRIIIPANAKKDPPIIAEVLAAGPGMLMKNGDRWPMPCAPGDMILFDKHAGVDIQIDGEKFKVIRDDSVLALLDPSTDN